MMQIAQGRFTADGGNKLISVPFEVDTFEVYNETQIADVNDVGVQYYWQRGMADKAGVYWYKDGGSSNLNMFINDAAGDLGFSLYNSADQTVGNAVAVTAVSNAAEFVVSTGNTSGLQAGDVVRLTNIATTTNTRGFDFEIKTIIANTSFVNRWALANVPGGAGGAGFYRKINFDPIFYPRSRYVVNITQAASAVVRTSVAHGYKVGQTVLFTIPSAFGMVELNNVSATVTAINTTLNTFTINVDSSAFTAFAWPATLGDMAIVAPDKMNTAEALSAGVDPYSDARDNQASRGMLLYAGDFSPAGNPNDVIYWVAKGADLVSNL